MAGLKTLYRRTIRPFTDGSYDNGGKGIYIHHSGFALEPANYIRAFLVIEKDLYSLFDYIHPTDANSGTFSFRTHEMLVRTCIEVEANFRAILLENYYSFGRTKLNIKDFAKLERTHRLSEYEVRVPFWADATTVHKPFAAWAQAQPLPWYQAYNKSKHDRRTSFGEANFGAVISAVCGLVALLASQFCSNSFGPGSDLLAMNSRTGGFVAAPGDMFSIKLPTGWDTSELYDFDYDELKSHLSSSAPFSNLPI